MSEKVNLGMGMWGNPFHEPYDASVLCHVFVTLHVLE